MSRKGKDLWRLARESSSPTADVQLTLLNLELLDTQLRLLQLEEHWASHLKQVTQRLERRPDAAVPTLESVVGRRRLSQPTGPQVVDGETVGGWGSAPLGWMHSGRKRLLRRVIVPVAEELETIRRIVALRHAGNSLRDVASRLTLEGRKTKHGGRWHAETIRKVLRRFDHQNSLLVERFRGALEPD
jgi:hypothetical protein